MESVPEKTPEDEQKQSGQEENADASASPRTYPGARRPVGPALDPEAGPDPEEGAETPSGGDADEEATSMHQFHEWSISRTQKKLRRLTMAFAAYALVTALALLIMVFALVNTRSDLDALPANAAPAAPADTSGQEALDQVDALNEDLDALKADVADLKTAPQGDGELPADLVAEVEDLGRQVDRLASSLEESTDCLAGAIAELDSSLRQLLDRTLSANDFVNNVTIPDCS